MARTGTIGTWLAATLLACAPLWAQESGDDSQATEAPAKATIRLMSSSADDLPEAVTREIRLPERLGEESAATENSQRGLETANSNRLEGNPGIETAEAAREKGAEMAEAAQSKREDRGRSGDRPEPPEPQGPPGPGGP